MDTIEQIIQDMDNEIQYLLGDDSLKSMAESVHDEAEARTLQRYLTRLVAINNRNKPPSISTTVIDNYNKDKIYDKED